MKPILIFILKVFASIMCGYVYIFKAIIALIFWDKNFLDDDIIEDVWKK